MVHPSSECLRGLATSARGTARSHGRWAIRRVGGRSPMGRATEVDIVVMAAPRAERPVQTGGIDALVSLVAGDMERVNSFILSRTGSDVAMIPEVASHLISSGGKRLRPMLTLAFAQLSGYSGDGGIRLAASVEFMHTATLLHDDVVDESDMRRGKMAARMLWGNEASVLVGDFLLGQAFKMMVEVGSLPALDVLASAAAVIAEGEVWQLSAAKNLSTDEKTYLGVVQAKTAALFAAAAEVGPILAGLGERERAAARTYGDALGIAFQLVDDALDYGGAAELLGKNVGDDFREGKITLPIVLALREADTAERDFWSRTLEQGAIAEGDLDTAIGILRAHGALATTLQMAQHHGDRAIRALDAFPDGDMKRALIDTVAFCIARGY